MGAEKQLYIKLNLVNTNLSTDYIQLGIFMNRSGIVWLRQDKKNRCKKFVEADKIASRVVSAISFIAIIYYFSFGRSEKNRHG